MRSDAPENETELIRRAKCADSSALEALLLTWQPLLYAMAGRIHCAWLSKEELVQAGYLGLMRAVMRFDEGETVRFITYAAPWAMGEMKRAIQKNTERYAAASLEEEYDGEHRTLGDVLGGREGIDIAAIDLRLAIQSLPEEEQTLICLRYYRDRTQKEAAVLLHKSQTQISRIEQRALDRLHAMLS